MMPFAVAGDAAGAGEATIHVVELFVLLIAAAAAVALVTRRSPLPYSVALVVLGLLLAALAPATPVEVTPELVLIVLVPGLVFEAAYRLDFSELRRTFLGVAILAIPGVLVSAAVVALALAATGLDLGLAFIVGAIVSATDPVAVIATFRSLGAPHRLATLVEAESLFNDGTAVVVFTIAVAAVTGSVAPPDAVDLVRVNARVQHGPRAGRGRRRHSHHGHRPRPPHRAGHLRGAGLRHLSAGGPDRPIGHHRDGRRGPRARERTVAGSA